MENDNQKLPGREEPGSRESMPESQGYLSASPPPFQLTASGTPPNPEEEKSLGIPGLGYGKEEKMERDGGKWERSNKQELSMKNKSSLYKKEEMLGSASASYRSAKLSDENAEIEGKFLAAEAKAGYGATVGENGVSAGAGAEGAAVVGEVTMKAERPFDWELFGERTQLILKAYVNGFVGAKGKVGVQAAIGKINQGGDSNEASKNFTGGLVGAEAEVFAGAKVTARLGAEYKWMKEEPSKYTGKIRDRVGAIKDGIRTINPIAGKLFDRMEVDDVVDTVSTFLFGLGKVGPTQLAEAEVELEGSIGAGAAGRANIGFANGKFIFDVGAKATWGVGAGAKLKVGMDILEGILFGIVVGGEVWDYAKEHLPQYLDPSRLSSILENAWSSLIGWASADNVACDMIDDGLHTIAPPVKRSQMILDIDDIFVPDEDEERILKVIEFSKGNGDLQQVIGPIGHEKLIGMMSGVRVAKMMGLLY